MSAGSFSASLSGLNANAQKLAVIGNNLANINTVGFKASDVTFADLVSQSVGGSSTDRMQIGLGVTVASITPKFTQGAIESTGVSSNVSIQGNGFFLVGDEQHRAYTRAGNFTFDANGQFNTPDGQPVQGWTTLDPLTGNINTSGQPGNIIVPRGTLLPPVATTTFAAATNLDANAAIGGTFTSSVPVYDALGVVHVASITYTKTATNAWDYAITVPGAEVTGGTPGTPFSIATGSLTFDGTGNLTAPTAPVTITSPAWANGATATNINWNLFDANGAPTVSAFASPSATSSTTQNGAAAGAIDGILIDSNGVIQGTYGAGHTVKLGQISLATFNNPQGLYKLGDNKFVETEASGIPSVGTASTGGRGSLIGSALEQSNVDIAQEFTQMILAQRGYQANSKTITVSDELLVETLNLKR